MRSEIWIPYVRIFRVKIFVTCYIAHAVAFFSTVGKNWQVGVYGCLCVPCLLCGFLISQPLLLFLSFSNYNIACMLIILYFTWFIDGNEQCLVPFLQERSITNCYLSFHVVSRNHLACKGRQWFPQGICINTCLVNLYNYRSIYLEARIHRHLVII